MRNSQNNKDKPFSIATKNTFKYIWSLILPNLKIHLNKFPLLNCTWKFIKGVSTGEEKAIIHEIFITSRDGQTFLNESFGGLQLDPELYSAFLSAILTFGSQFTEELREIHFASFKIVFFTTEKLILTAVVDKYDENLAIARFLTLLATEFKKKFGDLEDWKGDLKKFEEFREKIKTYVKLRS